MNTIDSRKPIVLHLLRSSSFSGAESVATSIMKLVINNYDSVYASIGGQIQERVMQDGLVFWELKSISIPSVRKAIHEIKPDIIHAHDFSMATLAALSRTEIPLVAHLHQNAPWFNLRLHPKTLLFKLAFARIDKIIVVSDAIRKQIVNQNLNSDNVEVLGNVVDSDRVAMLANCERPLKDSERFYLVFLGRLSKEKDPLAFVRIVRGVVNRGFDIDAVMVGDGIMRDEVVRYIYECGLENRIKLTGYLENPYPIIVDAFALVAPSKWEGFGLAAVEALCLGVPVVARSVGGLVSLAAGGTICESEEEMIAALCSILSNEEARLHVLNEETKAISPYTDIEGYKGRVEDIYRKVLL